MHDTRSLIDAAAEAAANDSIGDTVPREAWDRAEYTTLGAVRRYISDHRHVLSRLVSLPDDTPVLVAPGWCVWDDSWAVVWCDAGGSAEAAQEYVDTGGWEPDVRTWWWHGRAVRVAVVLAAAEPIPVCIHEHHVSVTFDPDEPECEHPEGHDWASPYSVVGGCWKNPGVWGHGGGVIIETVCRHCGRYKVVDTWATDPYDGRQGLVDIEFRPADAKSLRWIESLRDAEDAEDAED